MCDENYCPNSLKSLFEMLNNRNVRYCHWKGNEHIEAGLKGKTDLDIWVYEQDYILFKEALIKFHFINVVSMKWQRYPYVEDWLGMDEETGIQFHVHLHLRLITGNAYVKEQYLPFDGLLLTHRIKKNGIYVCDPNLEIIFLVMRMLLKRPDYKRIPNNGKTFSIRKDAKKEFEYLLERIDPENVKNLLSGMFPEEIYILFENVIFFNMDNRTMRMLRKSLISCLKSSNRFERIKTFIDNIYRHYFVKILGRLGIKLNLKKKQLYYGSAIAFVGVDGSGKTTISDMILKWLSWKMDARYVYMGIGDGNKNLLNILLKKYSKLKQKYSPPETKSKESSSHKQKSGLKLLIVNFNSYLNAKSKKKAALKMNLLREKGAIVIMNRYPQLAFEGINDGVQITNVGNGLLKGLNTRLKGFERKYLEDACSYVPDVLIKLTIPFEVSRLRKQDSPEETIKRKMEIIEKLHIEGADEFSVDNSGELKDTLIKVKSLVWTQLYDKYNKGSRITM